MPSELELQLEGMLAAIPPSSAAVRGQARRTALEALGAPAPRQRRLATTVVVLAALVACLVAGGVTLAATSDVQIPLIHAEPAVTHSPSHVQRSVLPAGTSAFVVTIGGREWHARPHSVTPGRGTLSALALSPGALYALRAEPHRLRAVATQTGRVAFTLHTAGTVTAAAWSPLPIRIAFVERLGGRYRIHDMWGTGSHDRVGGLAAPVAPSWRWDSLAVAYVRANGRVAVLSPGTGAIETIRRACGIGRAMAIAYSPSRNLLAIADQTHTAVVDTGGGSELCLTRHAGAPSLTWTGGRRLAVGAGRMLTISTVGGGGLATSMYPVDGTVTALAVSPRGGHLALAIDTAAGTSVAPLRRGAVAAPLFALPGEHGATSIQWR